MIPAFALNNLAGAGQGSGDGPSTVIVSDIKAVDRPIDTLAIEAGVEVKAIDLTRDTVLIEYGEDVQAIEKTTETEAIEVGP